MTLLRNADRVKIACLAQLVNVIAPIMTDTDGGVWKQSIFYPFMQVANHGQGEVLVDHSQSATYNSREFKDIPYLDTVSTYDAASQTLTVFAENKHQTDTLDFDIDLTDFTVDHLIEATQFYGYDVKADNRDGKMQLQALPVNAQDHSANVTLQPLSWNMLRFKVK